MRRAETQATNMREVIAVSSQCPKCGYLLQPFDDTCPKCARMAETRCAVCGREGVVATCEKCHKEVCAECATSPGPETTCNACRAAERAEIEARSAPVQTVARAPGGYGFFDGISRAFVFLRESVVMAFRDKDLILPAIFATVANAVMLGIIMLVLWQTGALQALADEDTAPWWWLIVGGGVVMVNYAITYFFIGMTVNLVDTHLRGGDARLGEAFADARKNFLALVGLAVVSTAVSLVTGMLRGRRGRGLGDIAAGAIDRVWVVATYLILPAIILEDLSLRAAANRARDLHGRNLLGIAVGEVGVIVLTNILGVIGFICAALLAYGVFSLAGGAIVLAVVVGALCFSLVIAFTTYVRAAYYTCLFLWAVATERQGEGVAAPAPLAASLA
ncbi:MAG: hypothetical protein JSV65_10655 [Armatimonadota bacterium]|nr:MAG: hypothetical protein JSV65_10655 [Armatimonadota bacterium]